MLPAHIVTGQKHKSDNEANSRASWNTPRSDSRSGLSYGSRMALSFALTSLMTVLILVCVIMVVWGSAFSEYTRANVIDLAKLTSEKLADSYEQDGEWTVDTLYPIAQSSSISDDIGLQVLDAEGTILYDDTWPVASVAADVKKSEAEPVPDTGSAEEGSVVATDQGSAGQAAATSAEGSATAAEKDEPKIKFDRHGLISTAPTDEEGAITEPITTSDGKVVGKVQPVGAGQRCVAYQDRYCL